MGHSVTISANVNGFDTDSKVTGAYAACMAGTGYGFCGRYITLTTPEASGDLTSAEAVALTQNGIAVLVIQHARGGTYSSNAAAASQGTTDGHAAVSNLNNMVAPSGITIYCDIEGFDTFAHSAAYADAWAAVINGSGTYHAGIYCADGTLSLTKTSWVGKWENPSCFGTSLPGANIKQGAEACNPNQGINHSCGSAGTLKVDFDTTLVSTPGFWGF